MNHNLIKTAASVVMNQDNSQFEKSCETVMRDIERASKKGLRKTCFNPYNNSYYEAVKREFLKNGYYFTPTGVVGGVYQMTEDINW